ncbi:hypothetical protein JCM6882_006305 [Rhodosporidiobolus microsporus]
MKLTLRPSPSYPVPPTLQTHEVSPPTLPPPSELRTPNAFLKARRRLGELGLVLPHYLAADRALWWQFAVREVEWDLEDEEVGVRFRDGSEERWELGVDEGAKSSEMIEDSNDEAGNAVKSGGGNVLGPGRRSPWTPSLVLSRLRELSVELRSAFEDVGMAAAQDPLAPDLSSESDYRELMKLSADPSREVPKGWSDAQALYEYANGVGDDEAALQEKKRSARPSQALDELDEDDDPRRFVGQFESRKRPQRLPAATREDDRSSTRAPHDYLSLVHLLTRIREYLADLFSLTILPKLREILPPTYSLWAVDGAIIWTRRQAIEASAEVAQLILGLVDDDGDGTDGYTSSEPEDINVFDGIVIHEPDDLLHGGRYTLGWHNDEKNRLDNPLHALKDDYQLRCWCETALERRREAQRDDWASAPGKPTWSRPIEPWSVTASVEGGSDLDEPRTGLNGRKRARIRGFSGVPVSMQPKTLTTPPTSPPGGEIEVEDDDDDELDSALVVPELEASTSSGEETDEDEYDAPSLRVKSRSAAFFYPEDLVDEQLLPARLPKEVVMAKKERSREMEKQRAELHEKLNEVAGLQKKLHDLHAFVTEETGTWEDAREAERKEKEPSPPSSSGLCRPGASSASPPPPDIPTKDVPIKAQPLRFQAADKALTATLNTAMNQLEPSTKARNSAFKHFNAPQRPNSPTPRKRQRFNLETHSKVVALEAQVRAGSTSAAGAGGSGRRREEQKVKKRKRSTGAPGVLAALRKEVAEIADDEAPPKKRRKKDFRPVKREGAVIFSDPLPSALTSRLLTGSAEVQPIRPAPTTAPLSSGAVNNRHLAVLELSNRRRPALENAQPPSTLEWLDSMELKERAAEDLNTTVPWESGAGGGEDASMVDAEGEEEEAEEASPASHRRYGGFAEDEDHVGVDVGEPVWGSFAPRTLRTSDLIDRPMSPIPSNFPSSSSALSAAPSSAAHVHPTSSERSLALPPSLNLEPLPQLPAQPSPSSPVLVAPQPLRSYDIRPFPGKVSDPASSSSSEEEEGNAAPPSGASSQQSLAQRFRETVAFAASPPGSRSPSPPAGEQPLPVSEAEEGKGQGAPAKDDEQ